MIIVFCAAGLVLGSVLNWSAEVLPRFTSPPPRNLSASPAFAVHWARWLAARPRAPYRLGACVEVLTALLAGYLYLRFDLTPNFWLALAFCALFILIALIDLRYRLILNGIVFPALACIVALQLATPGANLLAVFVGGGFGLAIFLAAAWLRPGDLGGGDIKLAVLIGLLFGFPYALWALMLGIFAGGLTALVMLSTRRGTRRTHIPYAPFLCAGAIAALLFNPWLALYPPLAWHL